MDLARRVTPAVIQTNGLHIMIQRASATSSSTHAAFKFPNSIHYYYSNLVFKKVQTN
jgi:hypothetical protein